MKSLNFFSGETKRTFAIITNTNYNMDGKYSVQIVEVGKVKELAEYGFDDEDFQFIKYLGVGDSYKPERGVIVNRLA